MKFRSDDCVMYCVANYPAKDGTSNPKFLRDYSDLFDCKIGYSSHDTNWEMNIAMLSYGAEFIERHYAQSNEDEGLDISTSSNLEILQNFNTFVGYLFGVQQNKLKKKLLIKVKFKILKIWVPLRL